LRPQYLADDGTKSGPAVLATVAPGPLDEKVRARIIEETQGNPFFVEEMYKHLVEEGKIFDTTGQFHVDLTVDEVDVPDNVSLVLRRRLDQLNEKAR